MGDNDNSRLELKEQNKELIRHVFELENDGHKDARELYKEELAGFLVRTDDGSYTLNSAKQNNNSETLHSVYGAKTEAVEKFIKPSHLKEKAKSNGIIKVLDLCSGIGYNAAALLEELKDINAEIQIDMIESSVETLAATLFVPNSIDSYNIIKKSVEQYLVEHDFLSYNKILSTIPNNVSINIHILDAREFILNHKTCNYDAVFLDPFSPARSPELYTVDFFNNLKEYLFDDAIILTYTAASPVRSALIESGFYIGEGPRFHRSGGTIASISEQCIETPLSFGDEKMIALSDVGVPFIDPDLDGSYDEIFSTRQNTRDKIRGVSVFPSSSKLPRYLGMDPMDIEDESLRNKLNNYVINMGFKSINDPEIMQLLSIDHNKSSRDQIIELKRNLSAIIAQK